jgi:hypothetical protein
VPGKLNAFGFGVGWVGFCGFRATLD